MEYCDGTKEKEENPHAKGWLMAIANGNQHAFDFMWRFWNFTQVYDDLVDNDKPVSVDVASREMAAWLHTTTYNPFYLQFKDSLFPLIIQACNRWIDGDSYAESDDPEKVSISGAVRCGEIDLVMHVAYLVGGWEHMRKMSGVRSYDKTVEKRGS